MFRLLTFLVLLKNIVGIVVGKPNANGRTDLTNQTRLKRAWKQQISRNLNGVGLFHGNDIDGVRKNNNHRDLQDNLLELVTPLTGSGSSGAAGNMFDLVSKSSSIDVKELDIHVGSIGISYAVEVYTRKSTGTYWDFRDTPSAWNLVGTGSVMGQGQGNRTPLPPSTITNPVRIPASQVQAFYITLTTGALLSFSQMMFFRGQVFVENDHLQLLKGSGKSYPFGFTSTVRIWNGFVRYSVVSIQPVPSKSPSSSPSDSLPVNPTITSPIRPSSTPSEYPSASPSDSPTRVLTPEPSIEPSNTPTFYPTLVPSFKPSGVPTLPLTHMPSLMPSDVPTLQLTHMPSIIPSDVPTLQQTLMPTLMLSSEPTTIPSVMSSTVPSFKPSSTPTHFPTNIPSDIPSDIPSKIPSFKPSSVPTNLPTYFPVINRSNSPSITPTVFPVITFNVDPTFLPSCYPSRSKSETLQIVEGSIDIGLLGISYNTLPEDVDDVGVGVLIVVSENLEASLTLKQVQVLSYNEVGEDENATLCLAFKAEGPIGINILEEINSFLIENPLKVVEAIKAAGGEAFNSLVGIRVQSLRTDLHPTSRPSDKPSSSPTHAPSTKPSKNLSSVPSTPPSSFPSDVPTLLIYYDEHGNRLYPSSSPTSQPSPIKSDPIIGVGSGGSGPEDGGGNGSGDSIGSTFNVQPTVIPSESSAPPISYEPTLETWASVVPSVLSTASPTAWQSTTVAFSFEGGFFGCGLKQDGTVFIESVVTGILNDNDLGVYVDEGDVTVTYEHLLGSDCVPSSSPSYLPSLRPSHEPVIYPILSPSTKLRHHQESGTDLDELVVVIRVKARTVIDNFDIYSFVVDLLFDRKELFVSELVKTIDYFDKSNQNIPITVKRFLEVPSSVPTVYPTRFDNNQVYSNKPTASNKIVVAVVGASAAAAAASSAVAASSVAVAGGVGVATLGGSTDGFGAGSNSNGISGWFPSLGRDETSQSESARESYNYDTDNNSDGDKIEAEGEYEEDDDKEKRRRRSWKRRGSSSTRRPSMKTAAGTDETSNNAVVASSTVTATTSHAALIRQKSSYKLLNESVHKVQPCSIPTSGNKEHLRRFWIKKRKLQYIMKK